LTATGVPGSEDNTRLFDVGAESWPDDEFVAAAVFSACLVVDRLVVDEPTEKPPPGEAFAELRTTWWLAVPVDVVGAANAWGAAATAMATPIPAELNPIARSGRTDTATLPYLDVKYPSGAMTLVK
jgi:hypothetical protein